MKFFTLERLYTTENLSLNEVRELPISVKDIVFIKPHLVMLAAAMVHRFIKVLYNREPQSIYIGTMKIYVIQCLRIASGPAQYHGDGCPAYAMDLKTAKTLVDHLFIQNEDTLINLTRGTGE